MKYWLSINKNFYNNNSFDWLFNLIVFDKYKKINGFELILNCDDIIDKVYCIKLLTILQKIGYYKFGFHMMELENRNIDKIINEIKFYGKISKLWGEINITIHPTNNMTETLNLFNILLTTIKLNKYNLNLCVENLNDINGRKRFHTNKILYILKIFPELFLTIDVGHQIMENEFNCNFDKYKNKIKNIHLHNVCNNKDHLPFTNCDNNISDIREFKKYLGGMNYGGNIIFEIGYPFMKTYISQQPYNIEITEVIKEYIKNIYYYIGL